ncbi:MAG: tetratricopeptide repeat protein [Opitutaceae bacterium]
MILMTAAFWMAPAAAGAPAWHVVRGEFFDVYSDAGKRAAIDTAVWLEQFRRSVGSIWKIDPEKLSRVRVVQFRKERDFEPYRSARHVGGYFRRSELLSIMAFHDSDGVRRLVQSECVYWLLASMRGRLPNWLHTGIAELYSTFEIEGKRCELFMPDPGSMSWLRENRVKSLGAVVASTREDIDYNDRKEVEAFHARAWVLTHYILRGRDVDDGGQKLRDCIALSGRGTHPVEALEQTMGMSMEEIERQLDRYTEGGRYTAASMDFPRDELRKQFIAEDAPGIEVECTLAALEICGPRNLDRAELRFLAARRSEPESPLPYEGLAIVSALRGDRRAAVQYFKEAVTHGSRHAYAHYLPAAQELHDRLGGRPDAHNLRPEDAQRLCDALKRALELDPSLESASQELGQALLFADPLSKSDVQLVANLVDSAADPMLVRYRVAGLLHRLHDKRVRSLLEKLASVPNYESLAAAAKADLEALDKSGPGAFIGARLVRREVQRSLSLGVPGIDGAR